MDRFPRFDGWFYVPLELRNETQAGQAPATSCCGLVHGITEKEEPESSEGKEKDI